MEQQLSFTRKYPFRLIIFLICNLLILSILCYIYLFMRGFASTPSPAFLKTDCGRKSSGLDFKVRRDMAKVMNCLRPWLFRDQEEISSKVYAILTNRFTNVFNSSGPCSNNNMKQYLVSYGAGSPLPSRLPYIHHIPHFAEIFFSFFSVKMYLDRQSHCGTELKGLAIGDSATKFWMTPLSSHQWMKDLVASVDSQYAFHTVSSPSCYSSSLRQKETMITNGDNLGDWFIHPSDALILGSLVLDEDVCSYVGTTEKVLSSNKIYFAILNRRQDRQIINDGEIVSAILSDSKQSVKFSNEKGPLEFVSPFLPTNTASVDSAAFPVDRRSVSSIFFFEGTSLKYQAQATRSVDLLLVAHGAGVTNVAWMKPCSIVIEVFPWSFHIPNYFGGLAKKSGLLHYSVQESRNRTVYTDLFSRRPECRAVLREVEEAVKKRSDPTDVRHHHGSGRDGEMWSADATDRLNTACFAHSLCKSCSRGADGVHLEVAQVKRVLDSALPERSRCLRNHPFLAATPSAAGRL